MLPGYDETRGALAMLRIAWAAALLAMLVVAAVVLSLFGDDPAPTDGARGWLRYLAVVALVVGLPLAMFLRNQVYKANWRGDAITPDGYLRGNILLFSTLEGIAVVSLLIMAVTGTDYLLTAVAAVCFAAVAVNFPTGKPMQPTRPQFGDDEDE
jgi:hypothetical protein